MDTTPVTSIPTRNYTYSGATKRVGRFGQISSGMTFALTREEEKDIAGDSDWTYVPAATDVGATGPAGANGAAGTPAATELRTDDMVCFDSLEDYSDGAISSLTAGLGWLNNGVAVNGSIVTRSPGSGIQTKRLQLAQGGSLIRTMPWGGKWQRLLIAIALRMNHNATHTGGPLAFGVCSGTTNHFGAASCDNFFGMKESGSANDWTHTTGTRYNYFVVNPSLRYCTRRATTTTDRGSGSGSPGGVVMASEGGISHWLLDISRPVFATAGTAVTYNAGHSSTDATKAQFYPGKQMLTALLRGMSGTVGGVDSWSVLTGSGNNTVTGFSFDESTGALDSLNIYWNNAQPLEIVAYGVRKMF